MNDVDPLTFDEASEVNDVEGMQPRANREDVHRHSRLRESVGERPCLLDAADRHVETPLREQWQKRRELSLNAAP